MDQNDVLVRGAQCNMTPHGHAPDQLKPSVTEFRIVCLLHFEFVSYLLIKYQ